MRKTIGSTSISNYRRQLTNYAAQVSEYSERILEIKAHLTKETNPLLIEHLGRKMHEHIKTRHEIRQLIKNLRAVHEARFEKK